MESQPRGRIKVPVRDKRRGAAVEASAEESVDQTVDEVANPPAEDATPDVVEAEVVQPDYLDDLRRLQAEFDNFRKRMMKQQAEESARGVARLIERLLPVLDNFERAVAHGEAGEGVLMVFKELKAVLEAEGLAEVPAKDAAFDPRIHEAVESSEDESVEEPVVRAVYRRGYTLNGRLLRPAMVAVARPPERVAASPDEAEAGVDPTGEAIADDLAVGDGAGG